MDDGEELVEDMRIRDIVDEEDWIQRVSQPSNCSVDGFLIVLEVAFLCDGSGKGKNNVGMALFLL